VIGVRVFENWEGDELAVERAGSNDGNLLGKGDKGLPDAFRSAEGVPGRLDLIRRR